LFFITIGSLFYSAGIIAQETPPMVALSKDSLVDLKKPSFMQRIGERYSKDTILPNKKGIVVKPGSTIGIGYRIRRTRHGQKPYGSQHSLTINYGITRGAFFFEQKSEFNQVIGDWSMHVNARFDLTNIINYYGSGNESQATREEEYYQLKSKEYLLSLGFGKWLGKFHEIRFMGFFQSIKLRFDDSSNFITTEFPQLKTNSTTKNFLGLTTGYRFNKKNNEMYPSRGIEFGTRITYFGDLQEDEDGFWRFSSFLSTYLPINNRLTLASRIGGAILSGNPQFYQFNVLGGRENLRGYPRQRFYGTSSFFTNQELRLLLPTQMKLFKQVGLLAFVDAGRVWIEEEISNKIHVGYGGGLIIIPFNKIVLNATYGISEEDKMTHLRVGYLF
jgi:hemolysin activation/secretion protein